MKSLVIAGFPGVGKSYLKKLAPKGDISDSDSSTFPKDGFPENYLDHIESLRDKVAIILTSTHKEVLNGFEERGIPYVLVHPKPSNKKEYLQRYIDRGSPKEFVELLDNKWIEFMNDLYDADPSLRIELGEGEYLKDKLL